MTNQYIQAAANNLVRAAADKRYEQQEVRRQLDVLTHEIDHRKQATHEQLTEHHSILASLQDSHEIAKLQMTIHDLQTDFNKFVEEAKVKLVELTQYTKSLEDNAKSLEAKSQSLKMLA